MWTVRYKAKEVIVLGGFPVERIPRPDRKTIILSSGNIKAAYIDDAIAEAISAGLPLASCLSDVYWLLDH